MRRLTLTEYQPVAGVSLSMQERDTLRAVAPSMTVMPTVGREGHYDLTPGSWVGAINLDALAIEIRPKLPIDRVLFLLSYAMDPRSWKRMGFDFGEHASVLEAIIPGFVFQV